MSSKSRKYMSAGSKMWGPAQTATRLQTVRRLPQMLLQTSMGAIAWHGTLMTK